MFNLVRDIDKLINGSTPTWTYSHLPDGAREQLAALAHEQWSDYMDYFFGKCQQNDDGSITVPAGYVAALRRQIATPYADLTEAEKESDRAEADRVLAVFK